MTPLNDSEARTVARFENAEPAPESWGHAHHWISTHDHGPVCSVCGIAKPECGDEGLRSAILNAAEIEGLFDYPNDTQRLRDDFAAHVLALPELAALRAKADAADRVRELAEELDRQAPEQEAWDGNVDAAYTDIADRIRRALDGADRTDRGRC